jgi:RNA-binding protein YhbY
VLEDSSKLSHDHTQWLSEAGLQRDMLEQIDERLPEHTLKIFHNANSLLKLLADLQRSTRLSPGVVT